MLRVARPLVVVSTLSLWLALGGGVAVRAGAAERAKATAAPAALDRQFAETVKPFVRSYCVSCHGGEKPKGGLDLTRYEGLDDVVRDHPHWAAVRDQISGGDMPPEKAKRHPAEGERKIVVAWIESMRRYEAQKNAGDPGVVLARRLSNAEYDNTIRDLTGADLRPTKEFPVDPANESGFDNSGESLGMSPALTKKYLEAAKHVAEHVAFVPGGLAFAPYPVVADTDRDRYSVSRIIGFYQQQQTDYARYFEAAWRWRYRAATGLRRATIASVAADAHLSPKYLAAVIETLEGRDSVGPIAKLQEMWRKLPRPTKGDPEVARPGCEAMRDFVLQLRKKLVPEVKNLTGGRVNNGSQPLLMWKNRQWVANRRRCDEGAFQLDGEPRVEPAPVAAMASAPQPAVERAVGEPSPKELAQAKEAEKSGQAGATKKLDVMPAEPKKVERDANLFVPSDPKQRPRYEAAFRKFCSVFPDAFYVSERGRTYADQQREKEKGRGGRLLNAGFHSMTGYFRDDGPLYELMLDEAQQRALDQLWDDFFFMSSVAVRMHTSFLWFERSDSSFMMSPEFGFTRPEDKSCTDEPVLARLSKTFEAKAQANGASEVVLQAIRDHFAEVNTNVRWLERTRQEAAARQLAAVQDFAERAYRRPLSAAEREGLVTFYRRLREKNGLEHEEAIRSTIASVLMSPHFLYRVEVRVADEADGVRPLSDGALASRLSYFLWASMPDRRLLDLAAAGKLHRPEVLVAEARRMLKDPRARGLATEFVGNWLDFRRFEQHNGVDRERFPSFDSDLRQAMFEEPIRFSLDVIQQDRPVEDFIAGKHTFVNPPLAQHYGMPPVEGGNDHWVRVDHAGSYGRGGLLPMSVFLTANSPGLRTSPVKRGYWVVRRVLGERIPAPPANVPELPHDEARMGEMTLRQVLERHRADKSCAGCHARFDAFGLVFEGYGPVGERRARDFGGRPIDARAEFPDGTRVEGLEGLVGYVRSHRDNDFLDNLCRKLLAYALGRTLILSDEPTITEMRARLARSGGRFGALVETTVTSRQFLNKRSASKVVAQDAGGDSSSTGQNIDARTGIAP
jgi:mono/diheme cytochrome c family protein